MQGNPEALDGKERIEHQSKKWDTDQSQPNSGKTVYE